MNMSKELQKYKIKYRLTKPNPITKHIGATEFFELPANLNGIQIVDEVTKILNSRGSYGIEEMNITIIDEPEYALAAEEKLIELGFVKIKETEKILQFRGNGEEIHINKNLKTVTLKRTGAKPAPLVASFELMSIISNLIKEL